jgi:hypothetical protein
MTAFRVTVVAGDARNAIVTQLLEMSGFDNDLHGTYQA